MKLVTFQVADAPQPRIGVCLEAEGRIVDLQAAAVAEHGQQDPRLSDMLAFLEGGPAARELAGTLTELAAEGQSKEWLRPANDIQLLSPVPRPASLRDCMSFERHLVQATRTAVKWRAPLLARCDVWWEKLRGRSLLAPPRVWYERPVYYKGNPASVVGPDHEIRWPSYTDRLDYELEFGVFIGRGGRDIAESSAAEHIAGYAIFNDFSARDIQLREMQGRLGPAKGKDFDTGNVIGPYLVTRDEIPDPYALRMTARVNGEIWSDSNSRHMHYRFEEIISYISRDETLRPGDFIAAGTAPGGCGLELDRWLQPDDLVELEVERLGILRNRVRRGPA